MAGADRGRNLLGIGLRRAGETPLLARVEDPFGAQIMHEPAELTGVFDVNGDFL